MFNPRYILRSDLINILVELSKSEQNIEKVLITPKVLASLRETAKLQSIHYSTMIEGNRLTLEEITTVINGHKHFPERIRDEKEILGYYSAFDYVQECLKKKIVITENIIKQLHGYIVGEGAKKPKATEYRDGQNVIKDSLTGQIVYLPPEAKDVSKLMSELIIWINKSLKEKMAVPIIAAITHYQIATIHPYYDGNGRLARLLTTLLIHLGGYGLKGIYSLDEYYAQDLRAYYETISVGPSTNYYLGREETDITDWIYYFCQGMLNALKKVEQQAQIAKSRQEIDTSQMLRELDIRQRKILTLFKKYKEINSLQVAKLLKIQPRTARLILAKYTKSGFLVITNYSYKNRSYTINKQYEGFIL